MTKGESYFFLGSPKPMSKVLDHVRNLPVPFPYPDEEVKKMTSSYHRLPAVSREGHISYDDTDGKMRYENTWMVKSESSGEQPNSKSGNILTNQPTRFTKPNVKKNITSGQRTETVNQTDMHEEVNEETPLLSDRRVFRELYQTSLHSFTHSPDSIERIQCPTNIVVSAHLTDPPPTMIMTPQAEDLDHLSTPEDSEMLSHRQATANHSNTLILPDRLHDIQNSSLTFNVPTVVSRWFGHWCTCGSARLKS